MTDKLKRICVVPRVSGVGGMVSFRRKLTAGLDARGISVCDNLADEPYQAVLVIGGTRQLLPLWRVRRRGIPVVQRLNGMNWLHRLPSGSPGGRTGLRHYLRAEYGNWVLAWIRYYLATQVVYQSEFARRWWEKVRGATPVPHTVIHNAVDLSQYTPAGEGGPPKDFIRLLMVEGSLAGGYEQGLNVALEFACRLQEMISHGKPQKIELMVVGRVSPDLMRQYEQRLAGDNGAGEISINWAGLVPAERIPEIDRAAHLLYSSDINPACPNSVIEALACGLPVVSFDTGALPELVTPGAGRVVAYGGDPWHLDPPDVNSLAHAATQVLNDQASFREGARARAEAAFGLDAMLDAYLQVLGGG